MLLAAPGVWAGGFGALRGYWLSEDNFPGYGRPVVMRVTDDAIYINKRRIAVNNVEKKGGGYNFYIGKIAGLQTDMPDNLYHRLEQAPGGMMIYDYFNAIGKRGKIKFRSINERVARALIH